MSRVLVVEDEMVIRTEVVRILSRQGHDVVEAGDVATAEELGLDSFDLVLTDLRLPGEPGDVLLERTGDVPVVVMTAFGSVRSAVDAMKRGAVDYLAKPFDPDELVLVVERTLEQTRLERKSAALQGEVDRQWQVDGMVGDCDAMQQVRRRIGKVAPTDATVLILGESGTGKELVARAIHAQSPRAQAAFVPVNCASIPEGLIESELFGHERGAFTGAVSRGTGLVRAAHQGTLFLDEIGELPPSAQARLLRVLQESEVRRVGASRAQRVDVRVLAATHRDLPSMVRDGDFREDLFFRLKVLEIVMPPLRDRGDDVLSLATHLLHRTATRMGRGQLAFSAPAAKAVSRHPWPGNVRELENAIERAVILHDEGPITPELLGLDGATRSLVSAPPPMDDVSLEGYLRDFVLRHQHELGEKELADKLGISRKTLWEKRQRLGIPRPKE